MSNHSGSAEDLARERAPLKQGSTESTDDHVASDTAQTRRTGNADGPGGWVPPAIVGAALGFQAQRQWRSACDVREIISRIRKLPPASTSTGQWLRHVAADTLEKTGPGGKRGAHGALRGHLFEYCDVRDYNLRRAGVFRLVQFSKPFQRDFDAIRFDANGKFAGLVQHKLGPAGIATAIKRLEARKPRLARKVTFRVPADQLEVCQQAANARTRVTASQLTYKTISSIANRGLRDLAGHGEAATSLPAQAGRAAAKSAAVSMAVGMVADLRWGGSLNRNQFAARRVIDAAQAGITAAAASAAIAGVTAGATCLASKAAAGSLGATVAGRVAASTVVAPAAAALVIGCAVSWAASRWRRYVTDRLQSPRRNEICGTPGPRVATGP